MRGPGDEDIPTIREGPPAGAAAAPKIRPPGGKALLRRLQFLMERGYDQQARLLLETAVPEDNEEQASQVAAQFALAPSMPPEERQAAPRRRRGGAAAAEEPAEPEEAEVTPVARAAAAAMQAVAQTYADVAQQMGPPTAAGPQWRSLGPWTIPNGQTYGASRVNVSGRVAAIAMDPSNPAHVLCGAAGGGVWESFDRGGSWAPRTDYATTLTVGALAFDPSNPRTVYCGTGEGNFYAALGAGILRSSDGGASWSTLCQAPFVGRGFHDLVVDRAAGTHLIAATTGGLYVSTDGGATWTLRRAQRTWSLAMAPAGGAGAEILAGCADGVFASTDGGATWTAVALPGSPGGFNRMAVAIAPSNPGVAYAWAARGATAYLWRRAGGTWTAVTLPSGGVNTNQAWYDWFLAVAPDNDAQVYIGAIDAYRGDLAGATWNWLDISTKPAGQDSIHPDQHAIAFEPGNPNVVYIGCDGGLFRSNNRGVNWQHCNNGLVISEFEYLAQHPGSARFVIGGTQDNGTARWTGPSTWEHIADGDGGDCGVNRSDPRIVFHTYYGMSPERSSSSGNFGSWTSVYPPVPANEGSPFYPPFDCSATNGNTIAMGGNALYVSRDNGANWTRLAYPSAAGGSAMYIPNADNVYVGVGDGRIFRTQWNGAAWGALAALGTPRPGGFVSDLFVDPGNLNRIWATYSRIGGGRVYRSDNGGSSWTDCTGNLPNLPANAIEVDPWNANRAWVALDLGVWQTTNGGASWADFSNALPNCLIGDLIFHPQARVLRAGTRNRGVWEIPVDGWMTTPICGVQFNGSLQGNQTQRWFTFNWPATWHVIWTVMPTTLAPGAPEITWKVQVERATPEYVTYWISVTNLTPNPIQFEGRYCILSRY